MTLKIAAFAPMPSARVMKATIVKPGFLVIARNPYLRSCKRFVITTSRLNAFTATRRRAGKCFALARGQTLVEASVIFISELYVVRFMRTTDPRIFRRPNQVSAQSNRDGEGDALRL